MRLYSAALGPAPGGTAGWGPRGSPPGPAHAGVAGGSIGRDATVAEPRVRPPPRSLGSRLAATASLPTSSGPIRATFAAGSWPSTGPRARLIRGASSGWCGRSWRPSSRPTQPRSPPGSRCWRASGRAPPSTPKAVASRPLRPLPPVPPAHGAPVGTGPAGRRHRAAPGRPRRLAGPALAASQGADRRAQSARAAARRSSGASTPVRR